MSISRAILAAASALLLALILAVAFAEDPPAPAPAPAAETPAATPAPPCADGDHGEGHAESEGRPPCLRGDQEASEGHGEGGCNHEGGDGEAGAKGRGCKGGCRGGHGHAQAETEGNPPRPHGIQEASEGHGEGGCDHEQGDDEVGAKGRGCKGGCRGGQGAGHGAGHTPPDRDTIHALAARHREIVRSVTPVDGGVVAETKSASPEVAALLRRHAAEMKARLESGQMVRCWDPLFAEIFRHHDAIAISVEEIEGGVRVRETSPDPAVARLLRQHAERAVSEFVAEGRARLHEPTPLPEAAPVTPPSP